MIDSDLDVIFEQEREEKAVWMAAFTADDPNDRKAFDDHWQRIRNKDDITIRTILFDGQVAGHIASFMREGDREVTYWIGEAFWGKGIATEALTQFLEIDRFRPIHGRVAFDNVGSSRVLERCGFVKTATERGYANARGEEIEEYVFRLE